MKRKFSRKNRTWKICKIKISLLCGNGSSSCSSSIKSPVAGVWWTPEDENRRSKSVVSGKIYHPRQRKWRAERDWRRIDPERLSPTPPRRLSRFTIFVKNVPLTLTLSRRQNSSVLVCKNSVYIQRSNVASGRRRKQQLLSRGILCTTERDAKKFWCTLIMCRSRIVLHHIHRENHRKFLGCQFCPLPRMAASLPYRSMVGLRRPDEHRDSHSHRARALFCVCLCCMQYTRALSHRSVPIRAALNLVAGWVGWGNKDSTIECRVGGGVIVVSEVVVWVCPGLATGQRIGRLRCIHGSHTSNYRQRSLPVWLWIVDAVWSPHQNL